MTRENKLALVVGFALILLVGILVSDHFSAARLQESADLLPASDPGIVINRSDPELLRFDHPAEPLDAGSFLPVSGSMSRSGAGAASVRMPDLQLHQRAQRAGVALPEEEARNLPYRFHEVGRGQSLTSIAEHYFGDGSLAMELGRYNGIDDPTQLQAGSKLRIPAAGTLIRGGHRPEVVEPTPQPARPRPTAPARTYTVKSGDVLSVIAQREMGSAKHWRNLYDHNSNVIDDPDQLKVGTVLRIPTP